MNSRTLCSTELGCVSDTFQSEQVTYLSTGQVYLKGTPFLFPSSTELDKLKASNTGWNSFTETFRWQWKVSVFTELSSESSKSHSESCLHHKYSTVIWGGGSFLAFCINKCNYNVKILSYLVNKVKVLNTITACPSTNTFILKTCFKKQLRLCFSTVNCQKSKQLIQIPWVHSCICPFIKNLLFFSFAVMAYTSRIAVSPYVFAYTSFNSSFGENSWNW